MRSLFMIISSGKLLFEVLGLLLTVRKCCHFVLVSLDLYQIRFRKVFSFSLSNKIFRFISVTFIISPFSQTFTGSLIFRDCETSGVNQLK